MKHLYFSFLRWTTVLTAWLALLGSSAWASSTEEAIQANIERFTQGRVKVDQVTATPARGIWQVTSGNEIFYVNDKCSICAELTCPKQIITIENSTNENIFLFIG